MLIAALLPVLPAQAVRPDAGQHAALMEGARLWLAEQHGAVLASSRFDALDARLRIPACATDWRYDHPFSSTGTVRARCPEPQAQFYLTLSPSPAAGETKAKQSGIAGAAPLEVYRLRALARAGDWISPDRVETQVIAPIDAPPRPLTGTLPQRMMLTRDLPAGSILRHDDLAKTRKVLISKTNITRGTLLHADLFSVADVDGQGLPPQIIDDPQHVSDAELIRDLPAGQVLRGSDIRPALMVRKGQAVRLNLGQKTGFTLSATVEALQDGRRGEIIKLKNIESGRVINGLVTGQSTAQGL
jgi:flagella basal body P-ring formation protein FlgA